MLRVLIAVGHLLASLVAAAGAEAPIIFQRSIDIDNRWRANVAIRVGQEPADAIFTALRPYGVDHRARRTIFEEATKAGVPYSRESALLFSQNIVLQEDASFSGLFTFYDDGTQPIDALYSFAKDHSIQLHFDRLRDALLPKLCELVPCRRKRPRIWHNQITSEDGKPFGLLEILDGDEAVDTVDSFVQRIAVDVGDRTAFRENLLKVICKSVTCTRRVPVLYRQTVTTPDGRSIGDVEVFEGEEVIDAAVRFIRTSNQSLDEITLKNHLLQRACGIDRLKCTRNVGVVYNQKINAEGGAPINTLTIYENEEPADKVFSWCKDNGVATSYMPSIMDSVCGSDLVVCNRQRASYFKIPISSPDGDYVNTLELLVGHEPADDIYAFFASNGLFKKGWDFRGVVNQLCEKPAVNCQRKKAVKHYDRNFTMGNVTIGPLVVWEDEEVADVLYSVRKSHNLTLQDQVVKFSEICKKPEVVCERTRAVVFHKTEITKLDYEKFGNETCQRQFVGVKYRSVFVNLPFGSKVAELLKEDAAKAVVEHPLFCVGILAVLLVTLHVVARTSRVRDKVHPSFAWTLSIWLVFLVAVLQAVLVEPDTAVDQAMHVYEGKLPDLVILEDEDPVDALLKWGKLAAKDHHPIVREPIYWEILDELCNHTEGLTCTRTRAWEFLNAGAMTFFGQEYSIEIYNSAVDPTADCHPTSGGANSCLEKAAAQFCERLWPPPNNCVRDITAHIVSQIQSTDEKRLDAKCSYKRLALEMDAPGRELYKRAASVARERRMNMSPFRRVDNGTLAFDTWSRETAEAHTAIDTFHKIHDPESREWNDKPCTPYFGGALCAKTDKDGNMMIEV